MKIQINSKNQLLHNILCKIFGFFFLCGCGGNKPAVMYEAPVIVHAPANAPQVSISESDQSNISKDKNKEGGSIEDQGHSQTIQALMKNKKAFSIEQILEFQSELNELKKTLKQNTNKLDDYINVSYYELYEYVLSLYFQKKYELALSEFDFLLRKFPDHPFASNCQYWIGECHYARGDYQKALLAFQKVSVHPNKKKYDDAQLMTANCYENLGRKNEALKTIEFFLTSYPNSEFAPLAKVKKTRLKERIKRR